MRPCLPHAVPTFLFLPLLSLCFSLYLLMVSSQQSYQDNAGYLCEPSYRHCETLAYLRVQSGPFSSLSRIAEQLFNTTSSLVANASSLSSRTTDLKPGEGLYIPLTCTCSGKFSLYNTTYIIMPGDTFVRIANMTYQGLTTCQAIQVQNPNSSLIDLKIGASLILPLRCACPSPIQTLNGIRFLVTYPVGQVEETISSVIDRFALDGKEFLLANNIVNASQALFVASTVLLPFKEKPTLPPNASLIPSPPFGPAPDEIKEHVAVATSTASATSIGITVLVLIAITAAFIVKKSQRKHVSGKTFLQPSAIASSVALPFQSRPPQVNLSQGMSDLATAERLIIYTINDIYQATQGFHVSAWIKGSVHRGTINGRDVAVKKIIGDALQEVQILHMLHHSSIISLRGFCIASRIESYLVYEYAENGSLHDWLHKHAHSQGSCLQALACCDQLQIALDIALAMEYLHDHTRPRIVHRNINSDNILLDSKMRGKMANFASAMVIDEPHTPHCVEYTLHKHVAHSKVTSITSHEHVVHSEESSIATSHEHEMHDKVSPTEDVYAFGEVLLEMLERKGTPECEVGSLSAAEMISGHNAEESFRACLDTCTEDHDVHPECAYAVAALAQSCLTQDASARPSARTVAFTLSKLLEFCMSRINSTSEKTQ